MKLVRLIYIVSKDRTVSEAYKAALERAAEDLRKWYAKQLNGPTFRLNDPVVEVVKSDKSAAWFYSNPVGGSMDDWGFFNALEEARWHLGARQLDPEFVWVIYSDGPGNKGRGGNGVAVLPEDDLLGLVGQHPTQKNTQRWIGGLGHELGHAFGLLHPTDTNKDADAIMWMGYDKCPERAYLTEEDKRILMRSRFFFFPTGEGVITHLQFLEAYDYPGGFFGRPVNGEKNEWLELNAGATVESRFLETGRDADWIQLFDAGRRMAVRLPVDEGECSWSTDAGKAWNSLYRVTRRRKEQTVTKQ